MAEIVKHTPGPWRIVPLETQGDAIYGPQTYGVAKVWDINGAPENKANARLIAAAPDLLDALKRILNPPPGVKKLPAWVYGVAGAAITKAEGRSS